MTPAALAELAAALVRAIDTEPTLSQLNGPDTVAVLQSAAGIYEALTTSQTMQRSIAGILAYTLAPGDD